MRFESENVSPSAHRPAPEVHFWLLNSFPRLTTLSMQKSIMTLCLSLTLLLPHPLALAWSGAGHQVIAAAAYRQLPPELQNQLAQSLKAHPEFEKWKESYVGSREEMDFGLYLFMRASTWPDEIRREESHYNHPKWHYIDYPLRPSRFPVQPSPHPANNILDGIRQSEQTLSARKTSKLQRAVALSWLIHLLGDLHQPLHCASFFAGPFPRGDKGGNDFFVKPATKGISLHSFWDGLLGTSGKPQAHLNDATEILARYPRKSLKELGKARTPKEWSLEGRAVAIEHAYLHGKLNGSSSRENAPDLPEGYTKSAKVVAEKQAALASCRLADEIQKWVR